MRNFVYILVVGCALLGTLPSSAQSSLIKLARSATAVRGAEKVEAVLKLRSSSRTLLHTPEGRKLLTDPDVHALLTELEGPAAIEFLAKHREARDLLGAIRQTRTVMTTTRTGTQCLTGECELSRVGNVLEEIEASAAKAASAYTRHPLQGGTVNVAAEGTRGLRLGSLAGDSVPLGKDVKLVVTGGRLSSETKTMIRSLADENVKLQTKILDIGKRCNGSPACIEQAVDKLAREPWFKRVFNKSCLGQHPAAVRAMLYSYAVAYTSLGIAYAVTDNPEFPFDLAAYTLIAGAMYSELGCRNAYMRGTTAGEAMGPYYTWKNIKANFIAYAKLEPVNVALFMGLSMGEDAVRGRDITDPEYLKKYAKEGAFLLLFDLGFLNMRAVLLSDPLYLRGMPKMSEALTRAWTNGVVGKVVTENGRKGVLWAVAAGTPAAIMETGTRVGQGSVERAFFLELRELYAPTPPPDGGPE